MSTEMTIFLCVLGYIILAVVLFIFDKGGLDE
jgi:hypothetical protein